jgi:hypothetical protein
MEPISSILRIFEDGAGYGDPYEFSATIRWITPSRVEILGVLRAPKLSEWKAINNCLRSHGVKDILINKAKDGKMESHIYKVR